MGIVKVMSVKYHRMLFTCTLRSPLMLEIRASSKIICSLKFEQLIVILCNRCQLVAVTPARALIFLKPNLLTFQSSLITWKIKSLTHGNSYLLRDQVPSYQTIIAGENQLFICSLVFRFPFTYILFICFFLTFYIFKKNN